MKSVVLNNEQYLSVFTDASKHTNGAVGIGIIIKSPVDGSSVTLMLRLTNGISIYKAELFAIYYAFLCISVHYSSQKICLYSDSLSSIAALRSGNSLSNPSLLQPIVSLISDSAWL